MEITIYNVSIAFHCNYINKKTRYDALPKFYVKFK